LSLPLSEKPLTLGRILGNGSENSCHERLNSDRLAPPSVIKIPNWFGRVWQTLTRAYLERCLNSLQRNNIRAVDIKIHEDKIIKDPIKGTRKKVKLSLETPLIPDFENKKITYGDLTDPETGPEILKQLVNYMHAANDAREKERIGYDPLGGELLKDILKGIPQISLLILSYPWPNFIKNWLHKRISGVQGQIRNLIYDQDQIVCIDIGMHDFSKKYLDGYSGKFQEFTKILHFTAFSAMRLLISTANQKLPPEKQIPREEIDQLPYQDKWFFNLISKLTWKFMHPLFEHYEKNQTQT